MNANIEKLHSIAAKPERKILGLMSGTSLDGLDLAYCSYKGSGLETEVKVIAFETIPYPESFKNEIRAVFAKDQIDFRQLCILNPYIGIKHAEYINHFLEKNNLTAKDVDLIASHGQTVYHAPRILHGMDQYPNATLQIGDADHIAQHTGIITLSDFRQKHCAAGGEGAPLAVYGDYLIFSKKGQDRILLNMGGISNFTYLSGDLDPNSVFATDTGPGNTLLDKLVFTKMGLAYDKDGTLAASGTINNALLSALLDNSFFMASVPKTTGPELFSLSYLENAIEKSNTKSISLEDQLATLCAFTAETIVACLKKALPDLKSPEIYMSGGGMHNPVLVNNLNKAMPDAQFFTTDDIGINGDAKEAVLFATLANEAVSGGKTNFGTRKGVPSVSLGKVSFAG